MKNKEQRPPEKGKQARSGIATQQSQIPKQEKRQDYSKEDAGGTGLGHINRRGGNEEKEIRKQ